MKGNQLSTSSTLNLNRKRIKPEEYSDDIYLHFQREFIGNLPLIRDDGKRISAERFFDICLISIKESPWYLPELELWFERRKNKVSFASTHQLQKIEIEGFFREYHKLFNLTQNDQLSGSIALIIASILQENQNPT